MNKSELVEAIAADAGLTKEASNRAVNSFIAAITHALKNGDQVVLPGFGSFSTANRSARTGRNPQTGQEIQINAKKLPKFKPGKTLKEAVE